ncbi:MAG: hypothetical protein QM731_14290 [Chitinophagaceae bacterium]
MAKQLGPFKYERTFGCVVFYRMGNKWYARIKSSLSGRRVKTSKKFAGTMAYARRLGKGAVLAGAVYEKLPESWKMFELYQWLTGLAAQLLKEGKCANDIRDTLELQLYDWGYRKEISYPDIQLKKKKIILRTPAQCRKIEETPNPVHKLSKKHKIQGTRLRRTRKKNPILKGNERSRIQSFLLQTKAAINDSRSGSRYPASYISNYKHLISYFFAQPRAPV